MFTKLKAYAALKGFTLVRILRPKHSRCGGETYRERVLILFCRTEAMQYMDMKPVQKITYDKTQTIDPTIYELDRSRNWSLYGEVVMLRRSRCLRFTTNAIVPASVVKMEGSARRWRVQARKGGRVDLMVTDRRASTRLEGVDVGKLEVMHGEDSEYKVFKSGESTTTVRASGEPPGGGGPLIDDGTGIWSCTDNDRGQLNDFTQKQLEDMDTAGLTSAEKKHMIGNAAPRLIVRHALRAIAKILEPYSPCMTRLREAARRE